MGRERYAATDANASNNNTGRERATPSQFVSRCGQESQQEHWLWARAVAHALFPAGPSMRDDDDDDGCSGVVYYSPPPGTTCAALRSNPPARPRHGLDHLVAAAH
jgi:hypothetical protein